MPNTGFTFQPSTTNHGSNGSNPMLLYATTPPIVPFQSSSILITSGLPMDITDRELRTMFRFADGFIESGLVELDDPLAQYLLGKKVLNESPSTIEPDNLEKINKPKDWIYGRGSSVFESLVESLVDDEGHEDDYEWGSKVGTIVPPPAPIGLVRKPFVAYAVFEEQEQAFKVIRKLQGTLYHEGFLTVMEQHEGQGNNGQKLSLMNVQLACAISQEKLDDTARYNLTPPEVCTPINPLTANTFNGNQSSSPSTSNTQNLVNPSITMTAMSSRSPNTLLWCENPPCNTLYVGNLPPSTQPLELYNLFSTSAAGFKRMSFRSKPNINTGSTSSPMCFVEFESIDAATAAMVDLYGTMLSGSIRSKGGIRLSYSKNPLGVRGNTTASNNSNSSTHSSTNVSNGSIDGNSYGGVGGAIQSCDYGILGLNINNAPCDHNDIGSTHGSHFYDNSPTPTPPPPFISNNNNYTAVTTIVNAPNQKPKLTRVTSDLYEHQVSQYGF